MSQSGENNRGPLNSSDDDSTTEPEKGYSICCRSCSIPIIFAEDTKEIEVNGRLSYSFHLIPGVNPRIERYDLMNRQIVILCRNCGKRLTSPNVSRAVKRALDQDLYIVFKDCVKRVINQWQ